MRVSVCCITYNHEKYIKQALDGFLMQELTGDWEIVISDDASSDSTPKILEDYARRYPGKINLILNRENLGMMKNFRQALNACKAEYVALCEGDDYWIDPQKLERQVSFLESNPDYSICFHAVYELFRGKKKWSTLSQFENGETFTIKDLADRNLMHTPSVVFRNGLVKEYPQWFNESPVGDYVLHMLNAQWGKIKYIPQPMAVYRIHTGGVWSQKNSVYMMTKWVVVLDYLLKEDFSPEVKAELLKQRNRAIVLKLQDSFLEDEKKFKKELREHIGSNSNYAMEWLYINYPALVNQTRNDIIQSKEYKIGQIIVKPLRWLKRLFISKK